LDEDELARAIPQGTALQESNAVIKLRKLMEDVSEKSHKCIYTHQFFYILMLLEYFFFLY